MRGHPLQLTRGTFLKSPPAIVVALNRWSTAAQVVPVVANTARAAARMVVFMVFPSSVGEAVASKKEGNLSM